MSRHAGPRALSGLRVIDLASEYGYGGKLFADLGADVVLVEPRAGCPARSRERPEVFAYLNAGKRSAALDIEDPHGREAFKALCAGADIVLDTRHQSWWAERGLGYESLRAANPDLVWCSVTPFGQSGPFAGYAGNDAVAMATGGMAWLTGYEEEGPLIAAGRLSVYSAGQYAAVMALTAALGREAVGHGQFIDVSVQEIVALGTETAPQFYDLKNVHRRRLGENERQAGVGTYPCRDGFILLYASEEGLGTGWTRLIDWMAESGVVGVDTLRGGEWLKNSYKATPEAMAAFRRIFTDFTMRQGKQALFEEGQRRRIAIAPVNTAEEVLKDPHLAARGSFAALALDGRTIPCPGAPYRLSRTPWRQGACVPGIGEHTADVVAEWRPRAAQSAPRVASPRRLPLEGIRVIDFTWVGAGPFTTKLLADFGAEVIKVESPSRPDQLRRAEPLVGNRGLNESGYFANRNTNKKSIALDMKDPGARDTVLALARNAHLIANSFSPGVMERFGLGYEDVRAVNPAIVHLSMPLSGDSGPYRDFLGYGMSIAALVGMLGLSALPGRTPVGTGTNYPDHMPNPLHAAFSVLSALRVARETGEGQAIVVAQIESTLATFPDAVLRQAARGEATMPGEPPQHAAPYGVFRCRGGDRWCAVSVEDGGQLRRLLETIGAAGATTDAACMDDAARVRNRERLNTTVANWLAGRDADEAMATLQAARVPAGVVYTPEELVNNRHLNERGFWQRLDHPVMGSVLYHGIAARWSETPTRYRAGAPLLGEHTGEVLSGLDRQNRPQEKTRRSV